MRKNANTEDRKNVHSEFVGNLNNLQQCMAKQDMMEQAYASDNDSMEENEEYKEPEQKKGGGLFGKIFGGKSAGVDASKAKKKRAAPTSMNIGSSMSAMPQKSKNDDAYAAGMYQASKMNSKKMFKK